MLSSHLCRALLAFAVVAAPQARQTSPAPARPDPRAVAPAAPGAQGSPATPPAVEEAPAATPLESLSASYVRRAGTLHDPDRIAREPAWRSALERAGGWARAQPLADVPPARRVELLWIQRWCAAELVRAQRRSWRLDPTWHVRRLIEALEVVPPREASAQAWSAYTARLAVLPEALLAAKQELAWLRPEFVNQGVETARSLARALDGATVERAARDGLARAELTPLGEASRRGRRAAEAFARWLEDAETSSVGDARLSAGAWGVLAAEAAGRPLDLEELEIRLAGAIASSARAPERAAAVDGTHDADRIVEGAARLAGELAVELGLLPVEGPSLSVSPTAVSHPLGPAVRSRPGGDGTWRLLWVPPGPDWPAEARAVRTRALTAPALWAATIALGSPGRGWLAANGVRGTRDVAAIPDDLGLDGWGLFAARWLIEVEPDGGVLEARPEIAAELGRLRREAAARALASLEFHALGRPADNVAARLALHTGWDPWTAARELDAVISDPSQGLGILAALELEALWDRWTAPLGRREALARILEALRRYPRARAADLELLSED